MKVIFAGNFDDVARRKIRIARGGTGKATRQDVRMWIDILVRSTLETIDEPRVRRKREPEPVRETKDPTALCARCGHPRSEHLRSTACPVSKRVPPRSTFIESQEARA